MSQDFWCFQTPGDIQHCGVGWLTWGQGHGDTILRVKHEEYGAIPR